MLQRDLSMLHKRYFSALISLYILVEMAICKRLEQYVNQEVPLSCYFYSKRLLQLLGFSLKKFTMNASSEKKDRIVNCFV